MSVAFGSGSTLGPLVNPVLGTISRFGVSLCLVGAPGAGKSATLAKLALEMATGARLQKESVYGAALRSRPLILHRCGESRASRAATSLLRILCRRIQAAIGGSAEGGGVSWDEQSTGSRTITTSGTTSGDSGTIGTVDVAGGSGVATSGPAVDVGQGSSQVSSQGSGDLLMMSFDELRCVFKELLKQNAVLLLLDDLDQVTGELEMGCLSFLKGLELHPLSRVVVTVTAFSRTG